MPAKEREASTDRAATIAALRPTARGSARAATQLAPAADQPARPGSQPAPLADPDAPPRTLLAIVDDSGILTPIVRFDGARWHNGWPVPDGTLETVPLPSSLAAVPRAWTGVAIPARWDAWVGARDRRTIALTAPIRYDAHCLKGFAVQTTLRPDQPPPAYEYPKKKVAIALSNAQVDVEPVTAVDVTSAAERPVLDAAARIFRPIANAAAANEQRWIPPHDVPVHWTNGWRNAVGDTGEQIFLLEGRLGIDGAVEILTGYVWLRMQGGAVQGRRAYAQVDDGEDFKRLISHVPLGVIVLGNRRFWLSEVLSWGHEEYKLTDLAAPNFATALRAGGGGC